MKKISICFFGSLILVLAVVCAMSYLETSGDGVIRTRPESVYMTRFTQRDLVVKDMRIRYIDEGAGFPVLLIPGHMSRIEEYEHLIAELKDSFRVLVLDFPGSGYSDKPEREYSLRFYEEVTLGFLDALGVKKCHIAGGSLGGNLSIRLGYVFPHRFSRIIAWGPGSAWKAKPLVAGLMRTLGGRATFWPTVRIQSQFWLSDDHPQKESDIEATFMNIREIMSPGFVRMYWGMAADQVGWSLFSIASGATKPTLLIVGEHDMTPEMQGGIRRLHSKMPHSEFRVIRGASHSIATTHASELSIMVKEFLLRPRKDLP